MYKIEMPRHGEDVAYAKAYATKMIPLIEDYLNNGKVLEVAVKNRGTVHVAVGKNTLTRSFLQKLSNITFLEKYLLMKPTTQVKLIQRLEATKYPDELIFSSITAGSKQSLRAVLRTLIKIYTFAPNFKFGTK